MTIATCRGFLLNFGVYYATREALALPFSWSPPVVFLARFMTVFAAVIAVTKDLSDIEGDRKGGIETFALRLGPGKVAYAASAVLLLNYMGAIATALFSGPAVFRRYQMILGHGMAAAWLVFSTSRLNPSEVRWRSYHAPTCALLRPCVRHVLTVPPHILDLWYMRHHPCLLYTSPSPRDS